MYSDRLSTSDRLFGQTRLAEGQATVIKQTYALLGLSVFAAMAGGWLGATTPAVVRFFATPVGWIVAMILLNAIPYVAMAARRNAAMGVSVLVADGFVSGLVLAPILFMASVVAPMIVPAALLLSGMVFAAVTVYVFTAERTFSAPRGLMVGMFASILGAIVLNSFLHIGALGILIAAAIGIMGVLALIYATSGILSNPMASSPIPGALMLFAGLFNVFVAILNILLRLQSSSRRD